MDGGYWGVLALDNGEVGAGCKRRLDGAWLADGVVGAGAGAGVIGR